jgi:hypothetical protein
MLLHWMQQKHETASMYSVDVNALCPSCTQQLAEINHPRWRHLPQLPHNRKEQRQYQLQLASKPSGSCVFSLLYGTG